MTLLALSITLTLTFGSGWEVTAWPVFGVNARMDRYVSLPGVIVGPLDSWTWRKDMPVGGVEIQAHELRHQAQWAALGPAFAVAYAASGGAAMEPYANPWGVPGDYWQPTAARYSLVSFGSSGLRVLPGWIP